MGGERAEAWAGDRGRVRAQGQGYGKAALFGDRGRGKGQVQG